MKFYTFAAFTILAITVGQMSQTHAAPAPFLGNILGNVLGGTVNAVGNAVGNVIGGVGNALNSGLNVVGTILGNIRIGVGELSSGRKIVTIIGSDGKIVCHLTGDIVSIVEQLTAKYGAVLNLKVVTLNGSTVVEITNKDGQVVASLTGSNALLIANIANKFGGQISVSINHVGTLVNRILSIVNGRGETIDHVTQNDVHSIGNVGLISNNSDIPLNGIAGLVGGIVNSAGGLINGVINVVGGTLNGILNGVNGAGGAIGQVISDTSIAVGSKVVSVLDAAQKVRGHLQGLAVKELETLAKLLDGSFSLTLDHENGSIAIVNKDGKTVGFIAGPLVPQILDLIRQFGGKITFDINTIVKNVDKVGNEVISVVNGAGKVIDNVLTNTIGTLTGKLAGQIAVIGNGLSGLGEHLTNVIGGIKQVVDSAIANASNTGTTTTTNGNSNANVDIQPGSPIVSVRNKDGQYIGLVIGGNFVRAMQEIVKQYGANIYLTLDNETSGLVCVSDEAGKVLEKISGNESLIKLIQQNGNKIWLNLDSINVVNNDKGEKNLVAVDNNGKVVVVITGNPISVVDNPSSPDKTYVVGSPLIGSGLVSGVLGGSVSVSTGGSNDGQLGGTGSVSTSGSNGGQLGGTWVATGGTNGGTNVGIIGKLLNSSVGVVNGLTGGLIGGLLGSGSSSVSTGKPNGGILGTLLNGSLDTVKGITGSLLGSSVVHNGGLLGGLSGLLGGSSSSVGVSNGGLLGGLTNSLLGGSRSVSTGGSLGGLLGGLTNGLFGGSSTGGSHGGLLGGILG